MALAHTETELARTKKADLIARVLELEAQLAESEREVDALRYRDDFPVTPFPDSDPRRRAERFMLAQAKGLVMSYRGVDTTIAAVSRAIVNYLREAVRQYEQAEGQVA